MPTINRAFKEISCKIVYYGPGLGGKTTNLQVVHKQIPAKHRGDLVSLATEQDRTLFFDFLPLDLGEVKGFKTKFQLYTVPGQVFYNATRKLVLRGVDGVVFVADSQADRLQDSIDSFHNLNENLQEYGLDVDSVPVVLQYNKRDLPNILSVSEMDQAINPVKKYRTFESVACDGVGVKETLKAISGLVLAKLNESTQAARAGGGSALAERAAKRQSEKEQQARAAQQAAAPASSAMGAPAPAAAPVEADATIPAPPTEMSMGGTSASDKPIRFRQEGRVYWKGFRIGSSSLEFAQRKNVDQRGEYQISGIIKGLFKKSYCFKMLEKVPAPAGSAPNSQTFEYYRERNDSSDKNPRVEAWVSTTQPHQLFVREIDAGKREIVPKGRRLKEIIS